ncbi:MAG: hypothetical protein ABL949_07665 [Fimbriimonadaceae bacterium]
MGTRVLTLIFIWIVSACAWGTGHYVATYDVSGSTITVTGPAGVPWQFVTPGMVGVTDVGASGTHYSHNQPNGMSGTFASWGSVNIQGPIKITFTWVPSQDNPGEPSPPIAVIKKFSMASWSGDFGIAENGLGNA